MTEDIKVTMNGDVDDQVRHLPIVKTSCVDTAKKIAERARAAAPVETGAYRDGIYAQETPGGGARVFASDNKSAWVEFGIPSHNQPARWTLRTAAESLGLKFTKKKA